MKRALLIPWFALAAASAQEPLTHETPRWLFATADLGKAAPDGRLDAALVDRLDGTLRIGFQRSDGGFDWTRPQATGLSAPGGLAVGRFNGVASWQVAVSASAANRASIFTPANAASAAGIRHVFPSWPAPRSIAAIDVDTAGADDLVVVGDAGGGLSFTEFLVQLDTAPASLWGDPSAVATHRVWAFRRKAGTVPVLGGIQAGTFLTAAAGPSGPLAPSPLPGAPAVPETRMTYGFFGGSALARVLLYVPGETLARSASVTEPTPGSFGWGSVANLTFPHPLQLIVVIPAAGGTSRLGVLYADGSAAVFDYDGVTLTPRSALPGGGHELLLPVAANGMLSLQGGNWLRWETSSAASILTPVTQGALPAASPAAQVSNIIFVSQEPFADPAAEPVFFGQTGAWTLAASGSGSSWSVTTLDQGVNGLENPAVVSYQPVPGAPHALPNQYRTDVSLCTLEPAAGPPVGAVFITPAAGRYPPLAAGEEFAVDFAANAANALIRFRSTPGAAWQTYNPAQPPTLAGAATVEAFARFPSGAVSPTRSASYTFGIAPPLVAGPFQDDDSNGLSDQWEAAFNLHDPAGDADGDGTSNYGEFIGDTDPLIPGDTAPPPLQLTATLVGSGPTLTLRLEWPLADAASRLESSETLGAWTTVASGITTTATHHRLDVPLTQPTPPSRFYRLARP